MLERAKARIRGANILKCLMSISHITNQMCQIDERKPPMLPRLNRHNHASMYNVNIMEGPAHINRILKHAYLDFTRRKKDHMLLVLYFRNI